MAETRFRKAAGWIFIVGGILPALCLPLLSLLFGYPDIIRAEPAILLTRLHEQRQWVPWLYYAGIGGMGFCLVLAARFLREHLESMGRSPWTLLTGLSGTLSGAVLTAGILRYALLFPRLAEWRALGTFDPASVDLVFNAFNTYAGETLAEHLQFLFSSLFMVSAGIAGLQTRLLPKALAWSALGVALVLVIGNLEFFGLKSAFIWNRLGAKLFAGWEIAAGLSLVFLRPSRQEGASHRLAAGIHHPASSQELP